jgi:hypothetical protein
MGKNVGVALSSKKGVRLCHAIAAWVAPVTKRISADGLGQIVCTKHALGINMGRTARMTVLSAATRGALWTALARRTAPLASTATTVNSLVPKESLELTAKETVITAWTEIVMGQSASALTDVPRITLTDHGVKDALALQDQRRIQESHVQCAVTARILFVLENHQAVCTCVLNIGREPFVKPVILVYGGNGVRTNVNLPTV